MVGIKKPAVTTAATIAIRRVVTCFIVTNPSNRIAIFYQCDTMSSFPSYWAGISGSIESVRQIDKNNDEPHDHYETPYQAARRELMEKTNLFTELENVVVEEQGGMYLDVPYVSLSRRGMQQKQKRIIRVYPFTVHIPDDDTFVIFEDLSKMESKCVPGLIQAFHHATYGKFNREISDNIRRWSNDKENGASIVTQNAIQLVTNDNNTNNNNDDDDEYRATTRTTIARHIAMLRPSMVPIVNVMNRIFAENGKESAFTMESLFLHEMNRCVKLGQNVIEDLMVQKSKNDTGRSSSNNNKNKKNNTNINKPASLFTIATLADRERYQRYYDHSWRKIHVTLYVVNQLPVMRGNSWQKI
jgi:hypothetical protein